MHKTRKQARQKRKLHIRKRVSGTKDVPRVNVFKSNRHMYVQAVDDEDGKALCALSSIKLKSVKDEKPVQTAMKLGGKFGDLLKKKKIKNIVFDRSGYKYHGSVKAVADGIRKSGIKF